MIRGIFAAVLIVAGAAAPALAAPERELEESRMMASHHEEVHLARRPHPEFVVPPRLRPRVDFWIDIFGTYGRHQVVLHHREYPQIRFGVLDFSREAAALSPVQYERHRKREVDRAIKSIAHDMKHLATGAAPVTGRQRDLVEAMRPVPGGIDKYRRAWRDDLIRSQTGIREKMAEAIERSGRYLHVIEKIFVEDYALPLELTRMPFVESSFDYKAYSSVGAAGIWQFMPRTARLYMSVNNVVDERRDPITATEAAAKYLKSAHGRLGTWPLAVISYNHGVGGVAKAVRKAGTTNIAAIIEQRGDARVLGFASNNFFPSLLASIEIFDNVGRYFPEAMPEPPLRLAQIRLTRPVSVAHVVSQTGVSLEALRSANYALAESVWKGRVKIPAGYTLKVPADYGAQLAALRLPEQAIEVSRQPSIGAPQRTTSYRVRRGDTLSAIAREFGVSTTELVRVNRLKSSQSIRAGQVLMIPQAPGAVSRVTRSAAPRGVVPTPAAGFTYTVKKGDTLWSISRRFKVSVAKIRVANNLESGSLKAGESLIIPR